MEIKAPTVAKKPKNLTIHGDTRVDPYYWLNDRENPEVVKYLEEENDYKDKMLAHTVKLQDDLFNEIIGRIKQTDMSVPYLENGYYYITRYEEGKEHPIYARKKESLDAAEEIMLEVNEMASGYDFYLIGGRSVSPDNQVLAFGEDTLSRRIYTLRFKDLETGEMLPDVIQNTTGQAVWANDNKTVYYTRKDDALRPFKIFRHILGTSADDDVEIYHEKDETFNTVVQKSRSGKYIIIGSYATLSNEYRILDADHPEEEFTVFLPREPKHEHFIAHGDGKFYIRTNWGGASNFRLMETDEHKTGKENWKEIIPHRPDVLLDDIDVFKNFLVVSERVDGITKISVRKKDGDAHYIDFNEETYTAYTSVNHEYNTDVVRVAFTSLTTPNTTYDYDMNTQQLTLLKQQEVVGDFSPDNYHAERIYATARDGVKVPISLVYRKGFTKDGSQPLLLYGYGSYGYSIDPTFNAARLSLLDRGFVFAIAHIRGGQEMGRQWYENGKFFKKKNTFTDFIDCAEHLVSDNYTQPKNLFALGGSAGGLLMGAVVNMAPELFKGVIAAVPFVDVVTTMLDESIPLTTGEYDEWGNPNQADYYAYMKSYSPYDNVEPKEYPAMLVTTGLHDSQVQYWEPAKWVAKLRDLRNDQNLLLLHTDLASGHSGQAGRFQSLHELAREYAFLIYMQEHHSDKRACSN
ncbi:MAG: S9 family peptidase [Saprospiraceae bacterium]|nr:S9 family peptidase [Saprospiraceae bacterium]